MPVSRRTAGIWPAIAVVCMGMLAGCGTSMNPVPSSSPGSLTSQSQPASGPVLGYVWDAGSQTLRPVQGIPGASMLGPTIVSPPQGAAFIASASSSVSRAALFLDASGGVYQSSLAGGKLTKIATLAGANSLVLSNSGAYALVTGKNSSNVPVASVISGLPQSPAVRALDLSAAASILGGAASDTGTVAVATNFGQNGTAVLAFIGQAAASQVATPQSFGGMQFVPGSDELVVADSESGAVTAISHLNTTASSAIVSAAGGIASPVSLDITPSGRWVVAANHSGDLLRIDLTGAVAATKSHCSCAPSQVLALGGTTVRLVTAAGPLWIVDAGNAAPRVLFIPAISVPTTTTTSASIKPAL